jgi:hypothetical protein
VPSLLTENVLQAQLSTALHLIFCPAIAFGLIVKALHIGAMGTVLLVSLFARSTMSPGVMSVLLLSFVRALTSFGAMGCALGTFAGSTLGALLVSLFFLSTQVSIAVVAGPFFYLAVTLILGVVLCTHLFVGLPTQVSMALINYSPVSSDPVSHTDSVKITEVATTNKTCTKRTKDAVSAVLNDNGSFLLSASVDNGVLTIISKAKAKPKVEPGEGDDTDEESG